MLHHPGEAERIAAGSAVGLTPAYGARTRVRVGKTNPMSGVQSMRVPLKIQRGNSQLTGSNPICENEPKCPSRHRAAVDRSLQQHLTIAWRNEPNDRLRVILAKRTQRRFRVAPAKRTQPRQQAARPGELDYPLHAGCCRPEQA